MPNKTCSRCGVTAPLEAFYRRADAPDGRQSWCKSCAKEAARQWEQTHPEQARAADRAYRSDPVVAAQRSANQAASRSTVRGARRHAEDARRYRRRNPEKVAARRAVERAVARGDLVRPPCACGSTAATEAHHHRGYDEPNHLDVVWLCPDCHREAEKAA